MNTMPRAVTQQGAVIISVARIGDQPDAAVEVHVAHSKQLAESGAHDGAMKKAFAAAASYIANLTDGAIVTAPSLRIVDNKPKNAIQIGVILKRAGHWVPPDMYIAKAPSTAMRDGTFDAAIKAAELTMQRLASAA